MWAGESSGSHTPQTLALPLLPHLLQGIGISEKIWATEVHGECVKQGPDQVAWYRDLPGHFDGGDHGTMTTSCHYASPGFGGRTQVL